MTLSTQDNAKLLRQLKSGFKRTIKWIKYQSKVSTVVQDPYLYFEIDPNFQGVNRFFVLLFENNANQKSCNRHFPLTVETKDKNVLINEKKHF